MYLLLVQIKIWANRSYITGVYFGDFIWSSTQVNATQAYAIDWATGNAVIRNKSNVYDFNLVRSFSFLFTGGEPILKRYKINNSTFDGYTGKQLSEKNIELLLDDERVYTRKNNINLSFFD